MTVRQIITRAAFALALFPGAALAQDSLFMQLDANGDGVIDGNEFLQLRISMFDRIDADRSGTITAAEIETARQALPGKRTMQSDKRIWDQDANDDGMLTLAEYTAQTRGFDMADRNNDGVISSAEYNRIARFLAAYRP
ncbi:EF-hand domain-containing protein [Salipiger abyssi]|uniref:EF-hand domain-containing protein n=1 Tax=Salipiger abyssi TaxID=1250539 RepID=UPI000977C903|nr:EF-hand domain-containing protein [Salipiger abyssi]